MQITTDEGSTRHARFEMNVAARLTLRSHRDVTNCRARLSKKSAVRDDVATGTSKVAIG